MAKLSEVVLDTNMLMGIGALKVDVFSEIEKLLGSVKFNVTKQVLLELKALAKAKGSTGSNARIALGLLERHGIKVIDVEDCNADESLVRMAIKGKIIATNDAALRKKIKSLGGRIIYLRKKKILRMD